MNRLESIAVGIDFSANCDIALRQAIRMARWNRAEIHLVHVIDRDTIEDLKAVVHQEDDTFVTDLVEQASDRLMELLDSVEVETLRAHVHVVVARPADGILDYCSQDQPDLLVLGLHGHNTTGATDARAGMHAMRVAQSAPVKTLLVHPNAQDRFEAITVCTDFSSYSDTALVQGVRIARQDDSRLELLHVHTPPWQVLHYRMPTVGSDPDFQAQYLHALTSRMQGSITRHAEGCPVEIALVEHFNHADGILERSQETHSDLLVIGNRGRSGLIKRFVLGSTAERVIQEADSSVLIIRAG